MVEGGNPLVGEVEIGGAKNAALAILAASLYANSSLVKSDIQIFDYYTIYTKILPLNNPYAIITHFFTL